MTIVVEPKALCLLTNQLIVSEEEIGLNPADNLATAVATVMPAAELAVDQEPGMEAALLGQVDAGADCYWPGTE